MLLLRLSLLPLSTSPLTGAAIRTYLLERSRVVNINDPERNYHVFYQVQRPPACLNASYLACACLLCMGSVHTSSSRPAVVMPDQQTFVHFSYFPTCSCYLACLA